MDLPTDDTTPNYWVLKFHPEALRMITPRRGPGKGRVYWYLLYTLENPSNPQLFDGTNSVTLAPAQLVTFGLRLQGGMGPWIRRETGQNFIDYGDVWSIWRLPEITALIATQSDSWRSSNDL